MTSCFPDLSMINPLNINKCALFQWPVIFPEKFTRSEMLIISHSLRKKWHLVYFAFCPDIVLFTAVVHL